VPYFDVTFTFSLNVSRFMIVSIIVVNKTNTDLTPKLTPSNVPVISLSANKESKIENRDPINRPTDSYVFKLTYVVGSPKHTIKEQP
jgi:hypothetical protein